MDVQALVEVQEVRLLSMSGASEEAQLQVVPDRAQDMHCGSLLIRLVEKQYLISLLVLLAIYKRVGLREGCRKVGPTAVVLVVV